MSFIASTRAAPELDALRQATQDLIDSYPSEIALIRPAPFQKSDTGGQKRVGRPRQLAVKKRYFQGIREPLRFLVNRLRVSPTGQEFHSHHVLIGTYDDDIQNGDYFDLEGARYHVVYVYPNRDFEIKAEVVRYVA